jgi:hypothetical protein
MKRVNSRKYLDRSSVFALALFAAGCAQATLVPADKPVAVGNGVTVTPQRQWNQINIDHILWTADGPNINSVNFYTGIKPGKPLFHIFGVNDKQLGVFDPKMLPNDIQDMVVSTVAKQGFQNVRSGNLAPCPFGTTTGFCFDLDFATTDGLQMKGMTKARKQGDTLDVLLFMAPVEYFYGDLSPTVSKLFASAETK